MSFEPFNWNAVVRGAWNRAILTPEWIAKFIFEVEKDTPLQVEIALNVQALWRVKHGNVAVLVGGGNLEAVADVCDYETLDLARGCVRRAIEALPITPLIAAGFNVRYRSEEIPRELATATQCGLDGLLSNARFNIENCRLHRSLSCDGGLINLDVLTHAGKGAVCEFNFHKGSSDAEALKSWLGLSMETVQEKIRTLIGTLPGVTV